MKMITFKQFLAEAAVNKLPQFEPQTTKQAIAMLNKHCKDALWMLHEDRPLHRGEKNLSAKVDKAGFISVDTSATVRKSQNTTNYYTVIIDNNPLMKDFPKRSRSFIASTSSGTAGGFAWSGKVYKMVPFDGVKIGVCSQFDMWETKINLFDVRRTIENMNPYIEMLGVPADIDKIKAFGDRLKAGDEKAIWTFKQAFPNGGKYVKDFIDEIWKAYSPAGMKVECYTTADMPHNLVDREVWVGGNVMLITKEMWDGMRNSYNQSLAK